MKFFISNQNESSNTFKNKIWKNKEGGRVWWAVSGSGHLKSATYRFSLIRPHAEILFRLVVSVSRTNCPLCQSASTKPRSGEGLGLHWQLRSPAKVCQLSLGPSKIRSPVNEWRSIRSICIHSRTFFHRRRNAYSLLLKRL